MTTDLLVTHASNLGPVDVAYTVKYDDELSQKRVLEKLEIERIYWERRGIAWRIITASLVKGNISANLDWIFDCGRDSQEPNEPAIREALIQAFQGLSEIPLRTVCSYVDAQLGIGTGRALKTARRMLSEKKLRADLTVRSLTDQPAGSFTIAGVA